MFVQDKIFMDMIEETKLKDFFYSLNIRVSIFWIFCYILILDFCRFKFYRN